MDYFRIQGGIPLSGTIAINGAKNAALPLLATSLLTDKPLILERVPLVADVFSLKLLLEHLGVKVQMNFKTFTAQAEKINFCARADYNMVRKMRASILVLGGLLGRCGKAQVAFPGGCAIGVRPVDYHIAGLQALGVDVSVYDGYIHAFAPKGRVRGGVYKFPRPSVTGTQNLLLAAVLAKGETRLENIALEPEVSSLVQCLKQMGAVIEGQGTSVLNIQGQDSLDGTHFNILPDRIEIGTYIVAALMSRGELTLTGCAKELMGAYVSVLTHIGIPIHEISPGTFHIKTPNHWGGFNIKTQEFPGFPTDLQSQFMVLATQAESPSTIQENIFENRFMHVGELSRMGAGIFIDGSTAHIKGQTALTGAEVMATDLRASVCLVLAALAAKGETIVNRVYHLDRGYENLPGKLSTCGAKIERVCPKGTQA
ncbi:MULTISPECIES: UDP-N-acetylglucosamine 1-carboxyvinyltransferase [Holospora]|uniref:UDP-N-acetylglucosamine 1-carboxyvinyltransferase n=2 Tax=Holospora TaxID=44747 RepID=A0A061JIB5_9PROT|nr:MULTISPECIES: UDP-N-acetylglucosamine 1-carboxyvinyltransferase [Holospora]ETZ05268.1 UDP-N-acetylglucosamine 1-carboxyvinyltransferase [Holospora undulata HU1]GAJ45732.1 UDP-N-acetylglucosamine 1-carboxyvinyltransferase [Holospora elegans E1]